MGTDRTRDRAAVSARRHRTMWLVVLGIALAELALARLGGHRGAHAARDLLLPGAGLIDERPLVGAVLLVLWVVAVVAWTRWGADWLVVLVTAAAVATTLVLTGTHDRTAGGVLPRVAAAHEFPVVVLVVWALSWLRSFVVRVPVIGPLVGGRRRRPSADRSLAHLRPVERARAVAITALATPEGASSLQALVQAPHVEARARRIALVARARTGPAALYRDHAHWRAALLLTGAEDPQRLAADAARSPVGLPCSEPTWVRPIDAVLVALALRRHGRPEAGVALQELLDGSWRLRRRHRPAWLWTPGTAAAGTALPWEHATLTALARAAGWITSDDDWHALRRRALGAAARPRRQVDDERLIAAARIWLVLTEDAQARAIVARPTLTDPLARSLDALARRLADDRRALADG